MSRIKETLDHKKIRRLVWLVLTIFVLLSYSLQSTAGSAYYSMVKQICMTVSSPPLILQNGISGTSMINTNETSAEVSAAAPVWLSGWDKRIKMEIDSGDVGSDLSSFPVLIHLSNSSGIYGEDVSCVFDEVGNNSKKIALTVGPTAETYVEVEHWDASAEQAWLWANVTASSSSNTTLYLYYDKDHADNPRVGDPNSTSAEKVWDSHFKLVSHMRTDIPAITIDGNLEDWAGIQPTATDPVGDTAAWSKNATLLQQTKYNSTIWTSTAEVAPSQNNITANDMARDLKAFYFWQDSQWLYFRLDVAGLYSGVFNTTVHTDPFGNVQKPYWEYGTQYGNITNYVFCVQIPGFASTARKVLPWYTEVDMNWGGVNEEPNWFWMFGGPGGHPQSYYATGEYNDSPWTALNVAGSGYQSAVNYTTGSIEMAFNRTIVETDTDRGKKMAFGPLGTVNMFVCSYKPGEAHDSGYDRMHPFEPTFVGDPGGCRWDGFSYAKDDPSCPLYPGGTWDNSSNPDAGSDLADWFDVMGAINPASQYTARSQFAGPDFGVDMSVGPTVTTSGYIDDAQYFDGANDWVDCGNNAGLDITDAITIEAWVKPTINALAEMFVKGSASTNEAYEFYQDGSKVSWRLNNNAITITSANSLTIDAWNHIVATYDKNSASANMKIFIDGVQDPTTANYTTATITNSLPFAIGAYPNYQYPFNGSIDEVRVSDVARSAAWIKASYESERDHLLDYGSEETSVWLSGWDKRIKIAIDSGDIGSDLSSFPVLIHLSNSSGIYGENVSCVFDEIGNNSKKIALTVGATTETYVEVEHWNASAKQAWLWANVTASSSSNTTLYLYYDKDHADNPRVGDPNSAAAQNVWDSHFKFISHMRDDPNNQSIRDSTSNNNDGNKKGADMPAITIDGNLEDWAGIQSIATDPLNDTAAWSKNATLLALPYNATIPSSTAENASMVPANDMARDLKALYFWSDKNWLYFRLDVAGLYPGVFNTSTKIDPITGVSEPYWENGTQYSNVTNYVFCVQIPGFASTARRVLPWYTEVDMNWGGVNEEPNWFWMFGGPGGHPQSYYATGEYSDNPWTALNANGSGYQCAVNYTTGSIEMAFNRTIVETDTDGGSKAAFGPLGTVNLFVASYKPGECHDQYTSGGVLYNYTRMHPFEPTFVGDPGGCRWDGFSYAKDDPSCPLYPRGTWDNSSNPDAGSDLADWFDVMGAFNTPNQYTARSQFKGPSFAVSMSLIGPTVTTSGYIDDAQYFDGANDWVDCGNNASLDITDGITIEAWVKPTLSSLGEMFVKGSASTNEAYEFYQDGSKVSWRLNNNAITITSANSLTINAWNHIVATYDKNSASANMKIFIAGVQDPNTANYATALTTNGLSFVIGAYPNYQLPFNGSIDEVRVSDVARSAAWIKASYESERDHLLDYGSEQNLVWLNGWQYRKSHVIGSASGAGTNYQMRIKVHYGSGTDSGENVYCNNHCRTDFGDIRFTDNDGQTLLNYWMEEKVDGDYAVFWVEVADDLSSSNATIYIYYGKSDATTTSNAVNTFIVGELFPNTNHWNPLAGSWSLASGEGNFPPAYEGIHDGTTGNRKSSLSDYSPPADFRLLARVKSSVDNSLANIVFRAQDNTNDGNNRIWVRLDQRDINPSSHLGGFHLLEDVNGAENVKGYYDFSPVVNQWYHFEILAYGSTIMGYLDGTSRWNATVTRTDSGYLLVQVEYFSGCDAFFDYICIGKYVNPEPGHGSWGSEESLSGTYGYVLKVVNQVADNWQVNLKVYGSSNIGRLTNAMISLHDGTTSDQIIVSGGTITQSEGPLYDLAGNATIYISISNLEANANGTSYIYVELKILTPNTSTYAKYVITFEIT